MTTCSDCGAALSDAAALPATLQAFSTSAPQKAALPWPGSLVAALVVTVVGALLAPLLGFVTLPYIERDALAIAFGSPLVSVAELSVVALGVMPWLSSALLVELVALLPPFAALRHGPPEQRARLDRWALVVGVVIATAQAILLVRWLSALEGASYDSVAPELWAFGPRAVVVVTLVGGACLVRLAAAAIDRAGVGNGLAMVLAGAGVVSLGQQLWSQAGLLRDGILAPAQVVLGLAVIGLPAAVAWRFVRVRPDVDEGSTGAGFVVRPSAGVVPFTAALTVPMALASAAMFFGFTPPTAVGVVAGSLVAAALVPLCAALFSSPARAAVIQARLARRLGTSEPAEPAEPAQRASAHVIASDAQQRSARAAAAEAMPHTWLLNGALLATWALGSLALPHTFIDALLVVVLAVTARDVVAEVQARRAAPGIVPIWSLHRFDLVGPVLAALAAEKIDGHLRGAHLRSLSHFFAPWVPIEILVDSEHADRARAIVRSLVERALAHPIPAGNSHG